MSSCATFPSLDTKHSTGFPSSSRRSGANGMKGLGSRCHNPFMENQKYSRHGKPSVPSPGSFQRHSGSGSYTSASYFTQYSSRMSYDQLISQKKTKLTLTRSLGMLRSLETKSRGVQALSDPQIITTDRKAKKNENQPYSEEKLGTIYDTFESQASTVVSSRCAECSGGIEDSTVFMYKDRAFCSLKCRNAKMDRDDGR
mmetsp:Transcript_14045/g.21274  ORF Transcript_14045/g.21274 Transcript_14045/m.21274 type:complete len:199 (+) Transcript_14045:81-677(+)